LEFAGDFIGFSNTLEDRQNRLNAACSAWNMACNTPELRKKQCAGVTIYNWEHEKARPRKAQLAALVAVRGIGKREALKKLAELEAGKKRPRRKR